jgi:hypothetical protein
VEYELVPSSCNELPPFTSVNIGFFAVTCPAAITP